MKIRAVHRRASAGPGRPSNPAASAQNRSNSGFLGVILPGPRDRLVEPGDRLVLLPLAGVRHGQEEPVGGVNALDQLDGPLGGRDRVVPAAAAILRQGQRVVRAALLRSEVDGPAGEGGGLVVIAGRAIGGQGQGPGQIVGDVGGKSGLSRSASLWAAIASSTFP